MSTHAAVCRDYDLKGRYVHWDGYPAGVGVELVRLLRTYGYHEVTRTLTDDHWGWSSLEEHPKLGPGMDDGRFVVVPGYGVAYTDKNGQSCEDDIVEPGELRWTYLMGELAIEVYGGSRLLKRVEWDSPTAIAEMTSVPEDFDAREGA